MNEAIVLTRQVRFEQLLFWRNRSTMVFAFVFPLALLVILEAIFGHGSGAARARTTLVPGMAAVSIVSATFLALAIALSFHRDQGIFRRLVVTPLRLRTLIAGKIVSSGIVAVIEVALIVIVARVFYGYGWPRSWWEIVAAVALGVLTFASMGVALAALIPSGDAAPAVTQVAYFALMGVSGVFDRISAMPHWLQDVARGLPLFHLGQAIRDAYAGQTAYAGEHLGILAAWFVVAAAFAIRRFRWEPAR